MISLVLLHSFWTQLSIVQLVVFTAKTVVVRARVTQQIVILAMYLMRRLRRVLHVLRVARRVLHQARVHRQPTVASPLSFLEEHASHVIHTVRRGVLHLATATKYQLQSVNPAMDTH